MRQLKTLDDNSHSSQDKPENDLLEDALNKLSRQARVIRQISICFLGAILLNVVFSIYMVISSFTTTKVFGTRDVVILLIPLFLFALVALLAALYDQMLHRGRGIFEEISDELEWHIRSFSRKDDDLPSRDAPLLHVRIVLRDFARSSNLPLLPASPASMILLLNLFLDIIVIALIVVSIQHVGGFGLG
jgi:hypothetical protein